MDASVRTARGTVSSKWWRRDDGRVAMIVKVPSNTPSETWVPTFDKPVDTLPNARFVRNDTVGAEPFAVFAVDGGGEYRFNLSTSAELPVGGTVPPTLSLSLGAPASLGAFTPGLEKEYTASTTANVISTAGNAALTVSDPGHLANGPFTLPEPLRVVFSKAAWTAPVSNDKVDITFKQLVKANDPLRTGTYSTTVTFTLSTIQP